MYPLTSGCNSFSFSLAFWSCSEELTQSNGLFIESCLLRGSPGDFLLRWFRFFFHLFFSRLKKHMATHGTNWWLAVDQMVTRCTHVQLLRLAQGAPNTLTSMSGPQDTEEERFLSRSADSGMMTSMRVCTTSRSPRSRFAPNTWPRPLPRLARARGRKWRHGQCLGEPRRSRKC